jgi:hypothetical protein
MPVPVGFPESGVVETPVKVMVNRQEGILLYASESMNPSRSAKTLFAEENLWNGEDTLTAVPGQTVTAYFFFGAEDAAGNRTFNPNATPFASIGPILRSPLSTVFQNG